MRFFFIVILALVFHSNLSSASQVAFGPNMDPASDIDKKPAFLGNEDIDITNYDVRMDFFDLENTPVSLSAKIDLTLLQSLEYIKLHTAPSNGITAISMDGKALGFEIIPVVHPTHPQQVVKIFLPNRRPRNQRLKIHLSWITTAYRAYQLPDRRIRNTRNLPYLTRNWLPSNDCLHDPATFSFEVHVPPEAVAAANGELEGNDYVNGSEVDGAGRKVFRWRETVPMLTYGLNVVVGSQGFKPYVETLFFNDKNQIVPETPGAHKIKVVYYRDGKLPASARSALNAAIYFSSAFGAYRFAKLGFVEAPHFSDMESPSLITVVNPKSDVHEVIHQWFGNSLRFESWSDFWISEGFTSYLTGLYDELTIGNNTAHLNPFGILNPQGLDADPLKQFETGDVPYAKGAAAVADIRRQITLQMNVPEKDPMARDRFIRILQNLYQDHLSKPLSSQGLVEWMRGPMVETLTELYGFDSAVTLKWVNEWKERWLVAVK